MRFAKFSSALALFLFIGGATSVLSSWAVSAACVLALVSAVVAAIAMDERDLAAPAGLMTTALRAEATELLVPAASPSELEAA